MKSIPLTRGMVALVSDQDYPRISRYRWNAHKCGPRGRYYASRGRAETYQLMHRMIIPGQPEVDHRSQDTLDNRRKNLRPATRLQNILNQGVSRANTSGYKGVSWITKDQRWRAAIRVAGRSRYLGNYRDPIAAARQYDTEALKQFGEFACVNFPRKTSK